MDTGLRQASAVVKMQPLGAESNHAVREEFLRFCERLCEVRHPNIATPYTYSTTVVNGVLHGYTTRAFVSGTPLSEFQRPLDEESVGRTAIQVAHALDAMHAVGLRHYDLKLENVVVGRAAGNVIDGLAQCKLIDISFRADNSDDASLSEVTLQYVAPELLGGEASDHRTDLYSMGVLLYTLLAGQLPFPGDSVGMIIQNQRSRNHPPLVDVSPTSRELARVVERLLEPYPDNRYASAQDLLAALVECTGSTAGQTVGFCAAGGLVGRDAELAKCLAAIGLDSDEGASCIELVGPAQSGITSVLREVQDRTEASGGVVLTARPKSLGGDSLQRQLALPIHTLVRQSGGGDEAEPVERRAAENTTDLLDDIYVAASGRRLLVFVDEWRSCSVSELSFLRRVVTQDQATLGERIREGGRCQVILGSTHRDGNQSPAVELVQSLVGERITLPLWTRKDLKRLVLQSDPASPLGNAACERIIQAAAGRPGKAVTILDAISWTDAGKNTGRAVEKAVEQASSSWVTERHLDTEIEDLLREPQGAALLALAMWGDALPLAAWARLTPTSDERDRSASSAVEQSENAVQTTRPHLAHYICNQTARRDLDEVLELLHLAVKPLWRSNSVDTLSSMLRFYCRFGPMAWNDTWGVCRALIVLLRHGRSAEVENAASIVCQMLAPDAPDWLRYFEVGARVEAGRAPDVDDLPAHSSNLEVYRSWINARALWKARHRSLAFEALESAVSNRYTASNAMLEDLSLLAAELGKRDVAIDAKRELVARLVRLRELAPAGVRRIERLLSRIRRVRQRIYLSLGRYGPANVAARRERNFRERTGNAFGMAAGFNNQGVALLKAGEIKGAIRMFDECMRIREHSDDERGIVVVLNNLALAHSYLAEPSSAAACLNRARVIALRNGLTRHGHLSYLNLGLAHVSNGQLRDARAVFSRLIEESAKSGDRDIQGQALLNYATLATDEWHLTVAARALAEVKAMGAERLKPSVLGLEIETAIRARDFEGAEQKLKGTMAPECSAVCDEFDRILGSVLEFERAPRDSSLTTRIRSAAMRRTAMGKRITLHSLQRVRRMASTDVSRRLELEWVVAYLAQAPAGEDAVALGWQVIGQSQFREGHDDLQIEARAHLGRILLSQGRHQEAWAVLTEALRHFRCLERKLLRWGKPQSIQGHLYRVLCGAMGIRPRDADAPKRSHSTLLQSEAFEALIKRPSSGMGAGREDLIAELGEALALMDSPDEVMDVVLSLGLRATGAHRALVVIAKGSDRYVRRYRLAEGTGGEGGQAELSWAVLSKVLSTGVPQIYGDALAAEQLSSHRSIAVLNLRSLACIPLRSSRGILGALYLDHHGMAGLFGDGDLGILTLLANVVALALDTAEVRESSRASEERLAEAHLHVVRGERNRLAGQVASGIAHDLKNILTTIVARSQLMMHREGVLDQTTALESIEKAARSAAEMIEKLQECSREHALQKEEPVDLASLAHEAIELLTPRFAVGTGIDVQVDAAPGVIIQGVAGELRELFLNLIINACDAMPDGGELRIVVRLLGEKGQAVVSVSDTGVGMSEEVRQRVFEPFFTTKGNDGTGLGLAVVRSAVVRHAGDVEVESTLGVGTTFVATFPIKIRAPSPDAQMAKEPPGH